MARPRKEAGENPQDNIQDNENYQAPEPTKATAPKGQVGLGHNTEYAEYHVIVTPHFRRQPGGGNEIYKYTGKKGELIRDNIRIEKFRADALSAKWYSRKHIFIEKGDETTTFEFIVNPDTE
jgi:hypothetical protein